MLISTVLGSLCGWFDLRRRYPACEDAPLLTLYARSGRMSIGVEFGGCLILSACRSGLRVGVWRIFGPFQRPFEVPWAEIDAVPRRRSLIMRRVELRFGHPEAGLLEIGARPWRRLLDAAPGSARFLFD